MNYFRTKYGYFEKNGDYTIIDPKTPMPWTNVLTNGRYGAVYSQSGSGYSFYVDASQSLLTRWIQDLVRDNWGKYFYILDNKTKEIYSATFQPVQHKGQYKIRFSPGSVIFETEFSKFLLRMSIVVPIEDDGEFIKIELKNKSKSMLDLSIFSYLELNMGTSADIHREFHKLFFETKYVEATHAIITKKYLWTAGSNHWNDSYPYVFTLFSSEPIFSFDTDKREFLGMYGDLKAPRALKKGICSNSVGRNVDAINALQTKIKLDPEQEVEFYFFLGVGKNEKDAIELAEKYAKADPDQIVERVKNYWQTFLGKFRVDLPDKDIQFLLNKWLPYQAIAGRLLARTAYYQMGGAYGYRDQLQDSLVSLWLNPNITKKQILLHAAHQRKDGTVQHWWLPLNKSFPSDQWSDDLLWLPFVVAEYIKHTGDVSILDEKVPFLEGEKASIKEHCFRSIGKVFSTRSSRGIPLILDGDWNDGLNNLGCKRKGESFWMSEFFYHVVENIRRTFTLSANESKWLEDAAKKVKASFEEYAFNGEWFDRATNDEGEILGGKNDHRIFLNTQIWAAISEITDEEKVRLAMKQIKSRLLTDYGMLLFTPPLTKPNESVGYLSRYSPGTRENGGVYTHAAVWALWAAWKLRDPSLSDKLYETLSPVLRSFKDPDKYSAEPYVTPGNSDGLLSSRAGRASWTWYTGSAGWLYRALIQYYIGLTPSKDGIVFSPCTKSKWNHAIFEFRIRNGEYKLEIINSEMRELMDLKKILVDGKPVDGNVVPYLNGTHEIKILY